jgi:hypothetical protein
MVYVRALIKKKFYNYIPTLVHCPSDVFFTKLLHVYKSHQFNLSINLICEPYPSASFC